MKYFESVVCLSVVSHIFVSVLFYRSLCGFPHTFEHSLNYGQPNKHCIGALQKYVVVIGTNCILRMQQYIKMAITPSVFVIETYISTL